MTADYRRGRDEMNLSVLPIARLGRTDKRTSIEYYGTFAEKGEQKEMVWVVDGGKVGLPTEFAERVLVALLHIAAEEKFANRTMYFTIYRILKILGIDVCQSSYQDVEQAISRLVALTIYSDQAWHDHKTKKRIKTKRVFHLIEEAVFHYEDEADTGESYITWGPRLWRSIESGYLKYLDLDFYYGLRYPLTRRLFRFLDKMMAYQKEYQIDIFSLQNKLGMAPAEYPSHLKRPIMKAADELVSHGWLTDYEFIKHGKFHRIIFRKSQGNYQLGLFDDVDEKTVIIAPVVDDEPIAEGNGGVAACDITLSPEQEWWNEFILYATAANKSATAMLKKLTLLSRDAGAYVFKSSQTDKRFINNVTTVLTRSFKARGDQVERIEIVEREPHGI